MRHIVGSLTLALVLGFGGSTSIATAEEEGSGWTRAPQPPFTAPAGVLCPFKLSGASLVDQVVFKTVATFPDGSPREQIYKGALVIRFTNDDTGVYVDRDLSSAALLSVGNDGSQNWTVIGPAAWAFFPADNVPRGMYVVTGFYNVYYAPDFSVRRLTPVDTPKENLCETLR